MEKSQRQAEIFELEEKLSFLISPDMDIDKKLKVLGDSFWRSHHAGYCDYMAGQRMAGVDDDQVEQHNRDWKYKKEVERLLDLLTECKEEELHAIWQRASDLFDRDNEAGYKAWLELSEQGHPHATHSVAWCYYNGFGVEKSNETAAEYYRRAIDLGYKSHASLFLVLLDEDKHDEGIKVLLEGAKKGYGDCFEFLASQCDMENIFGGNSYVTAYLASRAFEQDETCGAQLGMLYLTGKYFPVVYPYAKYCFEKSNTSRELLEECGYDLPEKWDEIEAMKPEYPEFTLTLDTCEGAIDPEKLFLEARKLYYADEPDMETANAYALEAMKAGYSYAMYYTFIMELDGLEEWLFKGADEYGDCNCIEALAFLFTDHAKYVIGDDYLNRAVHYWKLREELHGAIEMDEMVSTHCKKFKNRLARYIRREMTGTRTGEADPDGNAVLLHTDGSFEKINVDFDTLEGLYAPLGCDRLNIISTQGIRDISDGLGLSMVMYCDERGMLKGLDENPVAAEMSGYEVIWGDVVICAFDKDYAPFYADELADVIEYLEIYQ